MAKPRFEPAAEQALVEQCRLKDAEAFGKIVDAYQARLFGFVRRMVRNEDEALDVTQEVFVRAFQAVGKFDGRCSLRTWLFRIAHNLCVDRARREDRLPVESGWEHPPEGEDPLETADPRWNPENVVLSGELFQVVEDAIASMSGKLRTVLLLHDREEMAYEEIAMAIDVPVGTVKSRLFLARGHLQRAVGTYLESEAGK